MIDHIAGILTTSFGDPEWGPTGQAVYERTYSRVKPNGERETWAETVARVVVGNLSLVYGDPDEWNVDVRWEAFDLAVLLYRFRALPAGRHLWASGVKGRQYLFNCHVAGWAGDHATHTDFHLLRLAEGGGVGANFSTRHLEGIGVPRSKVTAHIVCDPSHPNYDAMREAGVLSDDYDADWPGAYEVEDTREGWADSITALIRDAQRDDLKHEARVFDLSRIRPEGARLKTMGGVASGPQPLAEALIAVAGTLTQAHGRIRREAVVSRRVEGGGYVRDEREPDWDNATLTPLEAMDIDHQIAVAIVAGGTRRSARMSIVHWADPHVFDFIRCKADQMSHWSTNISVEYDNEFLEALDEPDHPKHEHAEKVLDATVTAMLTNGEPGFWNSSLSNIGEPNEVVATNPCGEIALNEFENCNLGHVNLDAFVLEGGEVDIPALMNAHRLMTRFLIRATYGDVTDEKQAAVLARNRRIGVGHFGVQGFLVKQGIRFSEAGYSMAVTEMLEAMAEKVTESAIEYCHDLRIPVPVKMRTVAPTGSIAKLVGASEGIHPIYARWFIRRVMFSETDENQARQIHEFQHKGHAVEPSLYAAKTQVVSFLTEDPLVAEVRERGLSVDLVESADQIALEDMLAVQALWQTHWADNAVSFTVNVPAEGHQKQMMEYGYSGIPEPTEDRIESVKAVLRDYLPVLKGTTMMIDGSRPQSPYERISEAKYRDLINAGFTATVDDGFDEQCASGACPIK